MKLEKAIIEILDTEVIDASKGLTNPIEVQFNPTEYTLTKGAQIAEIAIPGIDSPILQFIRGQNEKLTLNLFFDTTRTKAKGAKATGVGEQAEDVTNLTKSIYQLVKIQSKTHAPPRIRFHWGKGLSFRAIVESVQQKFTLFSPLGVPLRATLTVSFREYKTLEEQISELKLESADHTKQRTIQSGDTLARIAAEEYDDPRLWREIADHPANKGKIPSARNLTPGTVLEIPPLAAFR